MSEPNGQSAPEEGISPEQSPPPNLNPAAAMPDIPQRTTIQVTQHPGGGATLTQRTVAKATIASDQVPAAVQSLTRPAGLPQPTLFSAAPQTPAMPLGRTPAPTVGPAASAAAFFDQCAQDAACSNWMVTIRRLAPAAFKGRRLLLGNGELENVGLTNVETLKETVKELHGGGRYRLILMDDSGIRRAQVEIDIPLSAAPPKVPKNAPSEDDEGDKPMADPATAEVDARIRHKQAEARLAEAEAEADLRKDEANRRREEARRKRDDPPPAVAAPAQPQMTMADVLTLVEKMAARPAPQDGMKEAMVSMMTSVNTLVEKMMQQGQQQMQSMQTMVQTQMEGLKTIVQAAATRPPDNGGTTLLAEAIKVTGDAQRAAATTMAEAFKSSREEAMKHAEATAAASDKFLQTILPLLADKDKSTVEVLKTLLAQQATSPRQTFQGYMADMKEFQGLLQGEADLQGGEEGEEGAGGFLNSPLARTLAEGLFSVLLQRRNEPAVQQAVGDAVGTPSGPFTVQQAAQVAQRAGPGMAQQLQQHRPLLPTPIAALPGPIPQPPQARNTVTASLRLCLAHLQAKDSNQTWIDEALRTWPPDILKLLVQCQMDGSKQVETIQANCDPMVWANVMGIVTPDTGRYSLFMQDIATLAARAEEKYGPPVQVAAPPEAVPVGQPTPVEQPALVTAP